MSINLFSHIFTRAWYAFLTRELHLLGPHRIKLAYYAVLFIVLAFGLSAAGCSIWLLWKKNSRRKILACAAIAIGMLGLSAWQTSLGPAYFGFFNQVLYIGSCNGCYANINSAVAGLGSPVGTPSLGTIIMMDGYNDVETSTPKVGYICCGNPGAQTTFPTGIKLIMNPGATITLNITNHTAGVTILDGSTLECAGAGFSGDENGHTSTCQIQPKDNTTWVTCVLCSQMALGPTTFGFQDSLTIQGITVNCNAGKWDNCGDIGAVGAPSTIAFNTFFSSSNLNATSCLFLIHQGAGGGMVLHDNEWRGGETTGLTTFCVQGGETTGYQGVTGEIIVDGGEISCMGTTSPAIKINGDIGGVHQIGVEEVWFKHIHSQTGGGCGPNSSADYIQIINASYLHFVDSEFSPGGTYLFTLSETAGQKTNGITFDNVAFSCIALTCATPNQFAINDTVMGIVHPFPSNVKGVANGGNIGLITHDEAGHYGDLNYGDSRRTIVNTTSSAFSYPWAPLAIVGPVSAPATTAGSIIARFNGANTAALWIGDDSYNGPWLQGMQDDGSNNAKSIRLNPLGGSVSVGAGGFNVNGGTVMTGETGTGTNLVTSVSPTITTPSFTGLTNNTGDQLFNTTTTCTTAAAVGAVCTTAAITLPVGYSDTNYRANCVGLTPTNIPIVQTVTKSNTTMTISVAALTAAAASFASFDCRVGHN